VVANDLTQLIPCRGDDALADLGVDAVADACPDLLGVVPADVLCDQALRQGFLNRALEALAHGFADPLLNRFRHPLVDGFGEALAQPLGGAIEVEPARSTLRLDERRADLLSESLAKQLADAIPGRVGQEIANRLGQSRSENLADPLPSELA